MGKLPPRIQIGQLPQPDLVLMKFHSNAEEMLNEKGTPKTSHTTNLVPFVMANAPEGWSLSKDGGVLGDVAPTVLAAMGIEQPKEMTGKSLLVKA